MNSTEIIMEDVKMRRMLFRITNVTIFLIAMSQMTNAQEIVKLPDPRIRGQLMKALENRVSFKGFSDREIPLKVISEVLWAGFGVNDPSTGRRTAASAFNSQEVDIYVIMASGAYRYDAQERTLIEVAKGDHRGLVAKQDYAANAPVHLMYIADHRRSRAAFMGNYKEMVHEMGYFHAGLIAQNVYLYCAANDMATVVRSSIDASALRGRLGLNDEQEIIVSQAVGYPDR